MFIFAITVLCAIGYLQTFSELPDLKILIIILSGLICAHFFVRQKIIFLGILFIGSLLWATWFAEMRLQWELPKKLESKLITLSGDIASIPVKKSFSATMFVFYVDAILTNNTHPNTYIRLTWKNAPENLKVGQRYQLNVRLKRMHGIQSPGAFDVERWAFQNGIRAIGYVVTSADFKLLETSKQNFILNQWRQTLLSEVQKYLPATKMSVWLMALIMGERQNIPANDWQVLRNTGTNHLMAIAGLHIGSIAGMTFLIMNWLWRRVSFLCLYVPSIYIVGICALAVAVIYSALAGFSLPTQRACIMFTVYILSLMLKRNIAIWNAWSLALILVLMINPLNVLSESFWLSFGTIALIIYGMQGRLNINNLWWKWGRVQWVVGIGLIPLSLLFFQQVSLISFFANSIAIPVVSFIILPLCLLGCLFIWINPSITIFLFWLADKSLGYLWAILEFFSQLTFSSWYQNIPNLAIFILTLIGILLLLSPKSFIGKWFGIIFCLPLLLYSNPKPLLGEFWVTVLDVGQGLSVVVQTQNHTLIYDAGAKYTEGIDMGESVVLPFLRQQGIKQIEAMVISHGDNDHSGGAHSLLRSLTVKKLYTSVPEKFHETSELCQSNLSWQWDNITFTFLYPAFELLGLGNDSSCVLKIENKQTSVLLTGDIEKFAENYLVTHSLSQLSTTILVAPHHGSKTSSRKSFVKAVKPRVVVYATGYQNRYHFPHPTSVEAYKNAQQLNTAMTGTIQFKIKRTNPSFSTLLYRKNHQHYWMSNSV